VLDTETAKQKIFSNPNLEHRCSEKQWKMLKDLHAMGVTLGIHTLATKATQAEPVIPSKATQTANIDYLRFVIYLITGNYPNVASYHGSGADPHPNIDLNGKGIDFVRGVGQIDLGKYNTPIQANTLSSLDKLDGVRVNTFFFHSNEVAVESPAKQVYNALIVGVKAKKYQAINYYQAMRANYG
jgi:hypothetical protein